MTRTPQWRRIAFAVAFCMVALVLLYWGLFAANSAAATAYGARIVCSCRYVADRDLDQCREDFLPGMRLVMLSEDAQNRSVTAWLPLLGSETATYRAGRGCLLESWTK